MIKVKDLVLKYGNKTVINNISFEITKKGIYGIIGPNGAGKSSVLNVISGCLCASAGEVEIGGNDINDKPIAAKKLIGYLPEIPPLYSDMTVMEYLCFVAEAKRIKGERWEDSITKVIERLNIADSVNKLIGNLSKGYRQRVGIAQAILGDPEIIILDEPTVGLDHKQITETRELLKALAKDHIVIISSHILSEIKQLCDHVIIMTKGNIVANETMQDFLKQGSEHPELRVIAKTDPMTAMDIVDELEEISHYAITEADKGTELILTLSSNIDIKKKLTRAFLTQGIELEELQERKLSFEELYLKITEAYSFEDEPAETENDYLDDEYVSLFKHKERDK